MEVKGCPSHTISQGDVVYDNGKLNVKRGSGKYINRPPFASYYKALNKQSRQNKPIPVKRKT